MHKCNGTDGNDNNAIDDENHDDDNDLIAKVAEERSKCKGCNRSDPTFNLRLTVNRIYIRVYQNVNKLSESLCQALLAKVLVFKCQKMAL